jgi:hypothetical protein
VLQAALICRDHHGIRVFERHGVVEAIEDVSLRIARELQDIVTGDFGAEQGEHRADLGEPLTSSGTLKLTVAICPPADSVVGISNNKCLARAPMASSETAGPTWDTVSALLRRAANELP